MQYLTLADHQEILRRANAARAANGLARIEPMGVQITAQRKVDLWDSSNKIDPWQQFYFRPVSESLRALAEERAEEMARIHRGGKKSLVMSSNSELIGKVGEFTFEEFCWYYYGVPTDLDAPQLERINVSLMDGPQFQSVEQARQLYPNTVPWRTFIHAVQKGGGDVTDFEIHGMKVDVKTRNLHTDVSIAPLYDIRVPKHELEKHQDVYVLAGYCIPSSYSYVIGWCSYEELQAKELNTQVKFAAKCVPLVEMYRPDTLADYLRERSAFLAGG